MLIMEGYQRPSTLRLSRPQSAWPIGEPHSESGIGKISNHLHHALAYGEWEPAPSKVIAPTTDQM